MAATSDQLLDYVPGTQGEEALCHQNTESGVNNIVLKAILEELQAKGVLDDGFDKLVADSSLDALVV